MYRCPKGKIHGHAIPAIATISAMVAILAIAIPVPAQIPQWKVTANDAAADDYFGVTVSISGDTAIIGARLDDDNGIDSGSAYIFFREGDDWLQQAKLTAADATAGDAFGVRVSIDEDTVIVGAYNDDDGGVDSGSAYVFTRTGTDWTLQAKLTADDAAAGDLFGHSVAIHGNTAVAGAINDDQGGTDSGSVYVFTRTGTTWAQQAKLTADDAAAGDFFGFSVAIQNDTVVVGARGDDSAGADSGSAYVFTRTDTTWSQQSKLIGNDAASGDGAGRFVAISGDTAIIGADMDDNTGIDSGSASVFVRNGTIWAQQARLVADDAGAGDYFGFSVFISGNTAVIGARGDDAQGGDSGAAYIFTRTGTNWSQQAKLNAEDAGAGDYFGHTVSISGNNVVIGAVYDDDHGSNSGSAYFFDLRQYVRFQTDGTPGASLSGDLTQTITYGLDCTPVEAIASPGYDFIGWTGDYIGFENPLTLTSVTGDMVVTACFQIERVARGSEFEIDAENVIGLARFTRKPKVYAVFTNPITQKDDRAKARVLTKIDRKLGAPTLACEWTKKIRLYDPREFKASEAEGIGAAEWITEAHQHDLVMTLHVASREVEDQAVQPLALAVPVIAGITDNGDDTLTLAGQWFGTGKPKVWREYTVPGKNEGDIIIERQRMKVVPPTPENSPFLDRKGKPAYMDPATGESTMTIIVPGREPGGTLNGTIVHDNGVGLAAYAP